MDSVEIELTKVEDGWWHNADGSVRVCATGARERWRFSLGAKRVWLCFTTANPYDWSGNQWIMAHIMRTDPLRASLVFPTTDSWGKPALGFRDYTHPDIVALCRGAGDSHRVWIGLDYES